MQYLWEQSIEENVVLNSGCLNLEVDWNFRDELLEKRSDGFPHFVQQTILYDPDCENSAES